MYVGAPPNLRTKIAVSFISQTLTYNFLNHIDTLNNEFQQAWID